MNMVEIIPFKNFKEQIRIVKEELDKGRFVKVGKDFIYSAEKWDKQDKEGFTHDDFHV